MPFRVDIPVEDGRFAGSRLSLEFDPELPWGGLPREIVFMTALPVPADDDEAEFAELGSSALRTAILSIRHGKTAYRLVYSEDVGYHYENMPGNVSNFFG